MSSDLAPVAGDLQLERALPLRDQVSAALEELIVSGVLEPGERLVETEIAKRLGVSRSPVREAMHALSQTGFVDVRPRHGAHVHAPTAEEVEDFFQLRSVLEVGAARLVARRIRPEDLADLRAILARGEAAIAVDDETELVEANRAFHGRVAQATHNQFFVRSLDEVQRRLRWYFRRVAVRRGPHSWEEHQQLVEAFEMADPDLAEAITRRHTDATLTRYREWITATSGS